jgi:hypothetical protein
LVRDKTNKVDHEAGVKQTRRYTEKSIALV